jgi:hypothetical protein
MNTGTPFELNVESSIDLLKRYVDIGYRTGTISIKDGSVISKWFRVLKGTEKDSELVPETLYTNIIRLIENFNSNKAYGIDDAAVIDTLFTFVNNNQLKKDDEPKVKEL